MMHVLGWEPTPAARKYGYTSPLTPDQQRMVASVRDHRRTAVPAGVGVGKTKALAGLALWFLYTRPGSKVISTAPGAFQVEHLLWREIRKAHAQAAVPLGGRLLTTELELSEDWFAIGLSPQKDRESETAVRFQGFHAPALMIILDEATGVHPSIWEAAEGLAVGPYDRFVAPGNPTDPSSRFKVACDSGLWQVVRISVGDHPNVVHDDPAIVPGASTKTWLDERLKEYGGADSPLARAKIYGLWPEQGSDALISLAAVERAQADYTPPTGPPAVVGCDVARFGTDETTTYGVWADGTVALLQAITGQNLMATVGFLQSTGAPLVIVDDTGVGGGVTDRLNERAQAKEWAGHVVGVNFGSRATDPEKYFNMRTELYWTLRDNLPRLHLPSLPRLAGDLTNVKYSYDSAARIVLEPKDKSKRRLGRSPDHGDGLALAVWGWVGPPTRPLAWSSAPEDYPL